MGLRIGYDGGLNLRQIVKRLCQEYVEKGLCVTITNTEFVYTGGNEPGFCVGLINYPRFPSTEKEITSNAIELADILMKALQQYRCTVVTTDWTYLLENEDLKEK
jgi:hypothetical protein